MFNTHIQRFCVAIHSLIHSKFLVISISSSFFVLSSQLWNKIHICVVGDFIISSFPFVPGGRGGCWSPAKSQYSSTDSRALLLSYVLPSSIQKNCQHLFCIEWKNKLRLSRKETKTETDDRNNNKTPILIDKIP